MLSSNKLKTATSTFKPDFLLSSLPMQTARFPLWCRRWTCPCWTTPSASRCTRTRDTSSTSPGTSSSARATRRGGRTRARWGRGKRGFYCACGSLLRVCASRGRKWKILPPTLVPYRAAANLPWFSFTLKRQLKEFLKMWLDTWNGAISSPSFVGRLWRSDGGPASRQKIHAGRCHQLGHRVRREEPAW